MIPGLGTKLLASMSGEHSNSNSLSDQEKLLEESMFTKAERRQQKEWLQRACCGIASRLPICTDFFYERFRSRFAFVCIAIQIYFYLAIESGIIFDLFGISSMPDCLKTLRDIDDFLDTYAIPINLQNASETYYFVSIFFMPTYLLISSIALISWNSPAWSILAAVIATANLAYVSIANGQFCTAVNNLIPEVNKASKNDYGIPFFVDDFPLSVVFTYNVLKIALCSIVTLILIILAMSAIKKKLQGQGKLFVPEKTGYRQPLLNQQQKEDLSQLTPAFSIDYIKSFINDFIENRLQVAPLRHVVACALTSTVLLIMSSIIVLISEVLRSINTLIWDLCKTEVELSEFKPPFNENDDYVDFQAYFLDWISSNGGFKFLAIFLQKNIGGDFIKSVFSSIDGILNFAPVIIWSISCLIVAAILYSFYPVSHHHEILLKRY